MVTRLTLRHPIALLLGVLLALAVITVAIPASGESGRDALFDASTTTDELFSMARDAFGMERYILAERYYEEILRRERTNLQAMLELSNIYERTGKLEYARGLLIRAARIDPRNKGIERRKEAVDRLLVSVLTTEVDSLLQRGSYETAIPKLSLLNTITPRNASVYYKRALCMFESGQHAAALSDIEVAIATDSQEPYFVLRNRIAGEIRRTEVKSLATQASRLAKSDNPRNRAQALALVEQILELDPHHTWARNELSRLSGPADSTAIAASRAAGEGPGSVRRALAALVSAVIVLGRFVWANIIAIFVIAGATFIFRSPLARAIASKLVQPPLLSGELSRFPLPEVLTMLNAEPHTGVLDIKASECKGKVYFETGEPRHCAAGKLDGTDALMELISKASDGRFTFSDGVFPPEYTIRTPLSLLLVEQAHKTSGTIARPGVVSVEKKSRMKELLDDKLKV